MTGPRIGKSARKAREKTPPKRPKLDDLQSVMDRAHVQVQQCSRQLAKSVIDRFDAANLVLRHPDITPAAARNFLKDAGIHEDDIDAFMNFSKALESRIELLPAGFEAGDVGDFLIDHDVQFPAILSLIETDVDTKREVLSLLSAGAVLSGKEIEELSKDTARQRIPARKLLSDMHQQNLQAATDRLAREKSQSLKSAFQEQVAIFVSYLEAHVSDWAAVPCTSAGFARHVFYRKVHPEKLQHREHKIIKQATDLIPLFDEIFPDAKIPEDDWLDIMESNPVALEIAQAHKALTRMSIGIVPDDLIYSAGVISWSALEVLQGFLPASAYQRRSYQSAPKRRANSCASIRRFNAIAFLPETGAAIPGIEAAGFRVRAVYQAAPTANVTISLNRPGGQWPISSTPTADGIRSAIKLANKFDVPINLIAGSLPIRPWQRQQQGAKDERHAFTAFISMVAQLSPELFFVETASEFMAARHSSFRRTLIEEFESLGYDLGFSQIDATEYGLSQARKRTAVVGTKRSLGLKIIPPVVTGGKSRPLKQFAENTLYPNRETSLIENTAYENWQSSLPRVPPMFTPDVTTLLHVNKAVQQQWEAAGFDIGGLTKPNYRQRLSNKCHVLTLADVKALQGLPSDWAIHGTLEEQLEQICSTTPPVIMRIIVQSLHSLLTGVPVNLSEFLNQPISTFFPKRFGRFRPMLRGDGYDQLDDIKRQHRYELSEERAADDAISAYERQFR